MKKGFTLVELIIVVTIVMLLGTIAVGMYFNTMRNFVYFTNFKNIQSVFRQARSFAITNSSIGSESPERFGVYIYKGKASYEIRLFSDKNTDYAFDKGLDTVYITKDYQIPVEKFSIEAYLSGKTDTPLTFPLQFFYEKVSGDFKAFHQDKENPENPIPVLIEKKSQNFIDLKISSLENPALVRHLVINQVSGLPEEYKSL